jgi:Rnl2 family RNA ligase
MDQNAINNKRSMVMDFTRYNSLENTYRQKAIDSCHTLGIPEWVALEKIHGSNFSFVCDGASVLPAKRSGIIPVSESGVYDFYGCSLVVEEYSDKVMELSYFMGGPIQVFGELFGNGVQQGINYGEKNFVAFDILLDTGAFIDWPTVKTLCALFDIPTAPEVGRGTLSELLSISPEFTSKLCEDAAEGFVIKPLWVDAKMGNDSRAILKQKSVAFSEKKQSSPKQPHVMSETIKPIFEDFLAYINDNRLNNILSKTSDVITQKDFGKIMGMLVQDAKDEFVRDEYEINKSDWKEMSKPIMKEASAVVRKDWLNILDTYSQIFKEN